MTEQKQDRSGPSSKIAMWGVREQLCTNGNVMSARTVMSKALAEASAGKLLPEIMALDSENTVAFDSRILGVLEWLVLLERAYVSVRSHAQLVLEATEDPAEIIGKSKLLDALVSGRKPQLAEELTGLLESICREAIQSVRDTFELAASKAPSKVDASIKQVCEDLDRMASHEAEDSQALHQLGKRAEQLTGLPALRNQMRNNSFDNLKRHLQQVMRKEYNQVLRQWTVKHLAETRTAACEAFRERCEQHVQDTRSYRARVRLSAQECKQRRDRAQERLAIKTGNQVVLQEATEEEYLAALMANRKAGSHSELVADLRHALEERLRDRAQQRGLGQSHARKISFRALVLSLPVDDVVDALCALITESTADAYSFYEACQRYGLDRLVLELEKRSRITSWFDGRDAARFGVTTFALGVVRMPQPRNPKETEIAEVMSNLFRRSGFHEISTMGADRCISVLRIYAGWPIGIEGGNPVLLKAYKTSVRTGHLPHLVGILPDTKAGEHAPSLLSL